MNNRWVLAGYAIAIFISSAVVMVLEITAGRLLAPYIGVSLYTWTSIIGVVLGGLSLGSWLGGRWADAGWGNRAVGLVLVAAGILSLASLLILTVIASILQNIELDLVSASFFYMLSLFFIPAVLLGVVTPLLTTLALKLDERAGHVVGRMHALAALGSIMGTFITGYWLVQYIGTRNIIVGCSVVLLLLALPFFKQKKVATTVVAGFLFLSVAGLTEMRNGYKSPCLQESNYFCIRVDNVSEMVPFGEAKAMVLDHLMHGVNHKEEAGMLVSSYVHLMDEIVIGHFGADKTADLNYFFAGGGAFTQPRAVKRFNPDARITVAEIDSAVTQVATRELYLDTTDMNIIHQDARIVLNKDKQTKYDVVVTDVFHDIAIPYHLVTKEYIALAKSRLSDNGLFLMNIVDIFPSPSLTKALIKTLHTEFDQVDVWLEVIPEDVERVTYVISANQGAKQPEMIKSQRGFERVWYNITEPLIETGSNLDELPLLTDNFAPVERLVSGLLLSTLGN